MDFYDSLFQYDLEVQNKLTERLNLFIKSINLLRNESQLNLSNNQNSKYKHINTLIEEINSSNKFKNKLLLNQKRNLLFKMNNKNKINSKYYIYAKDMNQDNQKMDIIEIENGANKQPLISRVKPQLELSKCFKQNSIEILFDNNNESQTEIGKDHNNLSEEEKELEKFKSDVNKIVCDIIKQEVKNKYINKINEIYKNKKNLNLQSLNENNEGNGDNSHRQKIKNNNFVRINLPKNEIFFKEEKEGKENKKNNNHSTEKNQNLLNYFNDKEKKASNKDLRNSVTNNNGKHLKIKVTKNDLLNFNNLNNKNFNNLLIINKKIKSAKENNNFQSNKNFENERIKIKETIKIKPKKEDIISSINENEMNSINNKIKGNNNEDNNEYKIGDISIKNNKKMIIRNIQKIQIKNIKLKNNPTGYNLTNICQKKLSDFDQNEKDEKDLKKSKLKNRQCASPGDVGLSNRKINILKFKLDRNEATPDRKNTEKLFKQRREVENFNAYGKDYDNSIISIIPEKAKDTYSRFIKFSSVRRKQREDSNSHNNDLSQFCNSKKVNINYDQNYKININSKNNLLKNSLTKETDFEKYFIADKNNIQIRKSLSKESDSHSYFKRKSDKSNALYINQSNIKEKVGEIHLNQFHKDKKDKNNCLYNGINFANNDKNNDNGNNINNYIKNEGGKSLDKYKKNKNKNCLNNNIIKQNGNLLKDKYNDTINNRDDLTTKREGIRMKGRRRILSTRVHIRGVNSSKNFNFI